MKDKNEAKAKGGHARALALSGQRKKQIAAKAAAARWIKATHKGNFKGDFGIDVDCYVLDDEAKTAVISQRGMGEALGLSKGGGSRLPRFVGSKSFAPYVGPELREKLEKPLIFQGVAAGPNLPSPGTVYGYDVTILIDLCRAIVEADVAGALLDRHGSVVQQAHVILSASAKAGIKGLVYALAGYNPEAEEIIASFRAYVLEEAKKYEKEFPPELYLQWARLYGVRVTPGGGSRSWKNLHLTIDHVYTPLAKSDGKLLGILRDAKRSGGKRADKLFQFLNEIGARALRMQLGRILEMAEDSATKEIYEKRINDRFGKQRASTLTFAASDPNEPPTPSSQSPSDS